MDFLYRLLLLSLVLPIALQLPSAAAVETPSRATGVFELARTLRQVVGEAAAQNAVDVLAADQVVSWAAFVHEGYDPDFPPGLLVYISPTYSGQMPRGWERVMAQHNLIWVAANESGNSVDVRRRALLALIAPTLIRQHYEIDAERVYVSGLSGGGKMASMVATEYAQLFKGAIYNCGVNFWDKHPPPRFEQIKSNRYVFVTGEHDQALRPTKKVFKRYQKAGVVGVKLMVVPDMGHENPDAAELSDALEFLDGGNS